MPEEKYNRLEELLTHQDRQILDLNEMVTRQWDEIDRLKKRMAAMDHKIDQLNDNAALPNDGDLSVSELAARDKPPHY